MKKFTGFYAGWNRCECGQTLLKVGNALKHRPSMLRLHNLVMEKKREAVTA
jgi:hypothetical protein